jgi:competence protein ComEA
MKRLLLAIALLFTSSFALAAININTASQEELEALPGIGPVKAQAIIEYRNANGPFKSPQDIMKVKGIKEGEFGKIRNDISVSGRTTVPESAKREAPKSTAAMAPAAPAAAPAKAAAPAPSAPIAAGAPAKDAGTAKMTKAEEEKAAKAKAKEEKAAKAKADKEAKAKAKEEKAAKAKADKAAKAEAKKASEASAMDKAPAKADAKDAKAAK